MLCLPAPRSIGSPAIKLSPRPRPSALFGLVICHWIGKYYAVVEGINLIRSNALLSIRPCCGRTA